MDSGSLLDQGAAINAHRAQCGTPIFARTIYARRGATEESSTGVLTAEDTFRALEACLRLACERWPVDEEWGHHRAAVCQVPPAWIYGGLSTLRDLLEHARNKGVEHRSAAPIATAAELARVLSRAPVPAAWHDWLYDEYQRERTPDPILMVREGLRCAACGTDFAKGDSGKRTAHGWRHAICVAELAAPAVPETTTEDRLRQELRESESRRVGCEAQLQAMRARIEGIAVSLRAEIAEAKVRYQDALGILSCGHMVRWQARGDALEFSLKLINLTAGEVHHV